jgi:CRP-like cAMP-binding protein
VRLAGLARAPYFHELDEHQLERIDSLMTRRRRVAGEILFRAGDAADELFLVAEGRVKLHHLRPDGSDVVSGILAPGDVFGALGTSGGPVHHQTAEALVDTCVLCIRLSVFRRVLCELPPVALQMVDDVTARLSRMEDDLGAQRNQTVAARLAVVLLRLADKVGRDRGRQGILLEVPLSRADLSGLARSTPESVSRVMSRWKQEGVVDSGRRWVALLDRDRLEQTVNGNED